jgi:hypothetical protein
VTSVLDRALLLAADRLDGFDDAARVRARSLAEHAGPLDLKVALDPLSVRTPALALLSEELEWLITTPGGRLIVSCPPQIGKSELAKHAVLRALQYRPDCRVAFTSYAEWLAARNAGEVRDLILAHGSDARDALTGERLPDRLGLAIDPNRSAESAWRIRGHRGGVIAKGVGSGLTGAPVEFLVCDDPLKDDRDADSPTIRARLHEWWRTVAETRLAPGAPVLVIATRWHEQDLSGWLIDNDAAGEWRVVNIPAFADGKTPDALGRPAGEWMTSARPRTVAEWEQIRARAGERVFAAMYQGVPAPVEGGVFKRSWFDTWRVSELPAGCLPMTVVVDPADNDGEGDEAGIILATAQPSTGRVFIVDDLSAPMSVGRWARVAMLTCVRRDAPTLAYEKALSRLPKRMRDAWLALHQQALAVHRSGGDRAAALARLSRADDSPEATASIEQQLAELSDADVERIVAIGPSGPRLRQIVARGQKQARLQWVAPQFETGRAVIVGRLPQVEFQLATWLPGQDSPDRADAVAHAATLLDSAAEASLGTASGERIPTRSTSRTAGGARIGRSTGRRR